MKNKRLALIFRQLTLIGTTFCIGFFITLGHASTLVSDKDLIRIEKEFKTAVAQNKPDPAHLYTLYLIAARELRAHGFDSKAREYYQKALGVSTQVDRSEAAIEIFHDSLRNLEKLGRAQVKKDLEIALKHTQDPEKRTYLNDIASGLLDGKTENNSLTSGFYGQAIRQKQLESLFEKKRYSEALALLDRKGAEKGPIVTKLTFDTLQVLVNRSKAASLLCEPMLTEYPDTYTYTLELCSALREFVRTGKPSQTHLANARDLFAKEKIKNGMLLTAIEDLK